MCGQRVTNVDCIALACVIWYARKAMADPAAQKYAPTSIRDAHALPLTGLSRAVSCHAPSSDGHLHLAGSAWHFGRWDQVRTARPSADARARS